MERVKGAPRARKKAVEPVTDLDVNKAETVTPVLGHWDHNALQARLRGEQFEDRAALQNAYPNQPKTMDKAYPVPMKPPGKLVRAEGVKPQRARTWWELLRS
jgi:hypothetical protein